MTGSADDMPFKLIKKICTHEDIVFVCRFGEVLLIKIDMDKIVFFDLTIEAIFNKTIPHELFLLDGLSEIEKKRISFSENVIWI